MTKEIIKAKLQKVQIQIAHAKILESAVERDPDFIFKIKVEGYTLHLDTFILENRVWIGLDTFKPITKNMPNSQLLQGVEDDTGQPPVRVVLKTYIKEAQTYKQSTFILLEDIHCVRVSNNALRVPMEEAISTIWEELDFVFKADEEKTYNRDTNTKRYVCRAGIAKLSKQKKELQEAAKAVIKVDKHNGAVTPLQIVPTELVEEPEPVPPVVEDPPVVKTVTQPPVPVEVLGFLTDVIKAFDNLGYYIKIYPKG